MPPTPLFLVSAEVRLDAVEVFFRSNRFCILPFTSQDLHLGCHPVEDLMQPLPIRSFLRSTVPDLGLPHLRFIELAFGPVRMNNALHAQLPDFYNKLTTEVTFIKEHLHLGRLTLVVHMADLCHHSAFIPTRAAVPDKVLRRVGTMYEIIGKRLASLSGLKCFYAFLAEPLRWSIEREASTDEGEELIRDLKSAKEIDMERLVMGDDYVAVDHGKLQYIQSAWYVKNEGWDEIYG
ncbi:hypothetical protein BDZ85DRAFT_268958 [Elsinoe ampelina]|uniref:Uncharacterized protein n=1 Tax=Elsinoe ampelina TaxID=302913 RepID=A0A6A6G136_9PEZI|nr:hypothetical protein BDZ85DRAFT_268958 [Elsinoe ampelina]